MKALRYCSVLVFTLALTLPLIAQNGVNGRLVSVKWLQKNQKNPNVLILDASQGPMYAAQHIPGAVGTDLYSYGVQDVPVAKVQQSYQSWGVSPGKKLVIYDQGASIMATRLFFDLYYHGYPLKNLYVLDGGLAKWQASELPVSKEPFIPKKGTFRITKLNEDVRVRLPDVVTASGDPEKRALVEGLDAKWHFGEIAPFAKSGHIPTGILMPSEDFYNPDKTFKSADELRKMFAYVGVKPEQQIYTYCGGGVAASVPFFAAKFILNYPAVKLFKESEMGWLEDRRDLPYWTYDAPYLMRETKWLQFWSSKMIRTYADPQISVVDVRPAGAFYEGHIPFALNIPGEIFRDNVSNPSRLAEILGSAGVNPAHEAVVVSGTGLTKESALGYLMLEKLGQKKISIFTDSLGTWTKLGYTLSTDTTHVGPKRSARDIVIAPVKYSAKLRKEVIVTDAKSTQGIYPKIFI
ncbi:MAG: rhodanese-like domain-containing protein, partial [Bacteroidota bacterium]